MKPQQLIALVVAIGFGLAAMVMTKKVLDAKSGDTGDENLVSVIVATADIQPGTKITETMVKTVKLDKELAPAETIGKMEDVVGFSLKYPLAANEAFTKKKLAAEGVAGIGALIPEGMRAKTVAIQTSGAVAGFIQPNSRVDILLDLKGNSEIAAQTITILQAVKVLAVDMAMQANSDEAETSGRTVEMVTFLVTPEDAERLAAAEKAGSLSLTLRNELDHERADTKGVHLASLVGRLRKDPYPESVPEPVFPGKPMIQAEPEDLLGEHKAPEPKTVLVEGPRKKRVAFKDRDGKVLMEVILDADSPIVGHLGELAEDVKPEMIEKPAKSGEPRKPSSEPDSSSDSDKKEEDSQGSKKADNEPSSSEQQ